MSSGPPLVAVVLLSWNGCEDTLACLRSLAHAGYERLHLLVVDNASSDGSAEAVAREFPDVELLRNHANLGYAGGMNVGIRRALELGADYVLLLNNDTVVEPGFLSPLLEEAERSPSAGALCPKILYADSGLVWYAGADFDPRRGYNGRITGNREPSERHASVHATDRAAGAAMLVPRAALEQVGLLDEPLFAYGEDASWSLRARAAGLTLLVVPASVVHHRVSAASGGESSPDTIYYSTRNLLTVCEREAALGPFATWRRRGVLVGAHLAQAARSRRRVEGARAALAGYRDFRRGRLGPRPAV